MFVRVGTRRRSHGVEQKAQHVHLADRVTFDGYETAVTRRTFII